MEPKVGGISRAAAESFRAEGAVEIGVGCSGFEEAFHEWAKSRKPFRARVIGVCPVGEQAGASAR
jgi:hypothetical protein